MSEEVFLDRALSAPIGVKMPDSTGKEKGGQRTTFEQQARININNGSIPASRLDILSHILFYFNCSQPNTLQLVSVCASESRVVLVICQLYRRLPTSFRVHDDKYQNLEIANLKSVITNIQVLISQISKSRLRS